MSNKSAAHISLDAETNERISRLASAKHRSTDGLVHEAIEQYIEREELRHRSWDAAEASWKQYQADGLHITGEEADEWLARLEAGEDVEPPKCHR